MRALAEQAERVIAITMFHGLAVGWADLVLPGTSYLERDGSYVNLEGRVQRLRRTVIPPVPDELAWLAKLAERFGVELSPHPALVFAELSELIYGGMPFGEVGERAPLPDRTPYEAPPPAPVAPVPPAAAAPAEHFLGTLKLQRYRPLFAGPAVERVPELAVPAARARDRARPRRRRAPPDRERRHGQRPLERDVGRAAGPRQSRARRRHGPDRRGVRRRSPPRGRGGEGVNEPWWVSVIKSVIIINLVMVAFAYLTLAERKVMGRMQLRYGPNRAGPFGLLQPIADLMKLIRKESFFPGSAVDTLYILAPFVAAFTALSTFAVIPFGPGWEIFGVQVDGQIADVPIALILIFAIGSIGIYGFIVGGWASDSKYALLGSMRTCAQLVSYEVSLALSVLGVVIMAHSLSLTEIVAAQDDWWYIVPQFVGFVVFMFAGTAETARAPFDLPEAEQELVAGYHTEYGGMRFGLFTMSEYINLITLSALSVTLFLGGWHFPVLEGLGPLWFVLKLFFLIFIFIWMRTTLPAPPLRPADALRLEGPAAGGDDQRRRHGDPRGGSLMPIGTAKGFGVTFRQIFNKPITQEYPEFKRPVYPRFRGRHRLHVHENGLEKCVGCSLCAAACPADCIRVVAGREHARQPRLCRRALRADLRDQHEPLHLLRLLRAGVPVRCDHARQRVRDLRVLARRPDLHEGHPPRRADEEDPGRRP